MAPSYELYDDEAWDCGEAMFETMKDKLYNEDLYYEIDRKLFRKIAAERRIASPDTDPGPFNFWCDDLRLANILVNADLRIISVID
ncbi:Uncharacterized protein TPAR_07297 [Tolypocladium paradoxum]|uniref:Aminoglycoside phosphotransferase domain-containing protein n=1 Tax=Tolypocladium paradoxum TaxID=94208 RepID=A0A2S4KQR0_9HYPO|nr:Uncharacterized protein TPAR_07297 [Tolypocladium paradoxum]